MKKLLAIIVLSLCFITPSQADDIKDFQIEGISVGDSLLDYMSAKDIKNSELNLYHSRSKFIGINFSGNKNIYEYVYVYVKRNDDNYKIHLIRAVNLVKNKNSCLKTKKKIVDEMKSLFKTATFQEGKQKHYYYKKSSQYISQFYYGSDGRYSDGARAECLIIDKDAAQKYNISSTIEVIMQYGGEFGRWLGTEDARSP